MFQVLQMNGKIFLLQCDPQIDQTGVFRCVWEFDERDNGLLFRVIDLKTLLNDIAAVNKGDFDPFAVVQIALDLIHMTGDLGRTTLKEGEVT